MRDLPRIPPTARRLRRPRESPPLDGGPDRTLPRSAWTDRAARRL